MLKSTFAYIALGSPERDLPTGLFSVLNHLASEMQVAVRGVARNPKHSIFNLGLVLLDLSDLG